MGILNGYQIINLKQSGDYKGRIMSGQFFFDGDGDGHDNERYAKHSVIELGYIINAGNKADTPAVTAYKLNSRKLKRK